jgi:polygalacturonase
MKNSQRSITACMLIFTLAATALGQTTMTSAPEVPGPVIPHNEFDISRYGAIGDGKTLNTAAFIRTIAACQAAGGGTVNVPAGRFLTGPFTLFSNLNLHVEDGATIVFSDNPRDFKNDGRSFENCIMADKCHDIAITGAGTIDGRGKFWWEHFVKPRNGLSDSPMLRRPFLIVLRNCDRLLVEDVTLLNSPNFHLVPEACRDVMINRVHILAPADSPNTDGIDLSGLNCVVTNCTVDTGDDNIVLKPNRRADKDRLSCENIWISDCTFLHGHGMSIGGQTRGGLRNMMVRNCTFDGTAAGIRMKAGRGVGGLVENVTYEHLRMTHVRFAILITSYYPKVPDDPDRDAPQAVNDLTPIWRHIRISDVTSEEGDTAGRIVGLPEMPVSDLQLNGVKLGADKAMQIIHADGIRFEESRIQVNSSPALVIAKSDVEGIDPVSGQ